MFWGRDDVYAKRGSKGGYFPQCNNRWNFGLGAKAKAKASRLLTSAVDGGYIKVMDPDTATRYKKYIPYWA